ncbi:MAG: ferredoxin family protein [Actinobacteria bacterium]|nr:ferredoxin family protein [Actinomycetota bacterium]
MNTVAENLFIDVKVDAAVAADPAVAKKLVEACPVDIFAAKDDGTLDIVTKNLDECVLCNLCVDAAPAGTVDVIKLYE